MANQFKVFAAGAGANALTPAEYAALTTLLANGFQSGVANSTWFNTVFRQTSFIAAVIGQIVDDYTTDALDNGDVTAFKESLIEALSALLAPNASATVPGIVELATDAETQTGTDTGRAVTPASLSARTATESRTGVVELATSAEALAGTDTSRAVTPAGIRDSLGATGTAPIFAIRSWVNFNASTGSPVIGAGGNVSSIGDGGAGTFTYNFATEMPDANYSISGSFKLEDNSTTSASNNQNIIAPYSLATTGFSFKTIIAANGTAIDLEVNNIMVVR